ncbi:MAG: type 2 isopentenyl-diphosphate Delta-isomerase [Cardiobacteriaceae bacterium]|nr:type 2 isopentenyl-diphosphate Delta-isomerase [Cardiobacteriaceae bacterium]
MNNVNHRKREHLDILAQDPDIERRCDGFAHIRLSHRALPEIALSDVDTRCDFLGKTLQLPLLISSMTGGNDALIRRINHNLAQAAQHCGIALAVGSQRVQFSEAAAEASFRLRDIAPDTVLISNLGAVQLNYGFNSAHCLQAVETLAADGIYLHLNPLQEAVQPEGDTNFRALSEKIAAIVQDLPVPVLLKEVGSGFSPADIALGKAAGAHYFDLSGRGGTSWSRIEHHRRRDPSDTLGLTFQDWGLTTVESLRLNRRAHPDVTLIASGGIRNGIDMAKAVLLGAQLCGIAAPFLSAAQQSAQAVIQIIDQLAREYRTALFLLGCRDNAALRDNHHLLVTS